jgi:hypothetical protein
MKAEMHEMCGTSRKKREEIFFILTEGRAAEEIVEMATWGKNYVEKVKRLPSGSGTYSGFDIGSIQTKWGLLINPLNSAE